MKRYLLIIAVLIGLTIIPIHTIRAQDQPCIGANFDTGWTNLSGNMVGGALIGDDTTYLSLPVKMAQTQFNFSSPHIIGMVQFDWLYNGLPDANPGIANITVYSGGSAVANQQLVREPILHAWFPTDQVDFGGVTGDSIVFGIYHQRDGVFPANQVAVRPEWLCSSSIYTATPSPTIAIESLTPTPSQTLTPTPPTLTATHSLTPSNTPTFTATYTPGGPSITPNPSSTNPGIAQGNNLFASAPPPKACGDIYNPCGALPFPAPAFATLALNSPTYISSVTAAAGFSTTTPVGSPSSATPGAGTGTAPPGTGTPNSTAVVGGITDFATSVGGMQASLLTTPVGIYGPDGQLADIPNAANEIGSHIGEFWGIVRGIQALFLGRAGTLIAFLLLCAAYIVLVKLITFIVPVFLAVLRWIFRMATIVAGALP